MKMLKGSLNMLQLSLMLMICSLLVMVNCKSNTRLSSNLENNRLDDSDEWRNSDETQQLVSRINEELPSNDQLAELYPFLENLIDGKGTRSQVTKRFGAIYQRPQRNRYSVRCLLNPITCFGHNRYY